MKEKDKKSRLLFIMLITIIVVLLVAIVYQFIIIKALENNKNVNLLISLLNERKLLS